MAAAAPQGRVLLAMQDTALDATGLFTRIAGKGKQTVKVPLACFTARGLQLDRMDTPFSISADAPFAVAIANIDIVGGAAATPDAVRCEEFNQEN
jgi:beta-glucosidase